MNTVYDKLDTCFKSLQEQVYFKPKVALVLGTGLGHYADEIQIESTLAYADIEGFPISTVIGHKGRFVFGYVKGVPVVIMQGRVHYYEGYSMSDVVLPIRLMGMMGAEKLILTNAAGGVNYEYEPGDFMLIKDHISQFVPSPLIGPNLDLLGVRFPDMGNVYNKKLRTKIKESACSLNISLREGVYVQLSGPNYETPSEIKMCRILGGDAVGMSTACEAMAANHMGIQVCGISCITNLACGMSEKELNHNEVQETATRVEAQFKQLITGIVYGIANE
ncbi:MAG: purine-nucleoside phosphorylase [Lachnospiraceae bacterium]